ncbi:UDP-3-O-acyl-N-acetylglucosamine deacetylase [candidate division NPL-UPA2 bacterium]|nr:UDP-3-O-acyl-N-acetylglucosamine deacetylase [candidate division NPL-UPA2 bacterium]
MDLQRTIRKEVSYTGVGLHTGTKTTVTFKPAPADSGVNFVRVDLPEKPEIRVDISLVKEAPRRTTLRNGQVEVHTVEHILAALAGLGLDNLLMEVDSSEVPEIDGSSQPFVEILKGAGLIEQGEEKRYGWLNEPIWISGQGAYIAAFPSNEQRISFTIDYDHPHLKTQFASFQITDEIFEKEIAPARTFCSEQEAKVLQEQGLGKGGTFENTVVIGDRGIVKGNLRFKNEFVRHKVLDLMGDLFLLGHPLKAEVIAIKSGHALNIKLVQKIHEKVLPFQGAKEAMKTTELPDQILDINDIQKILPHRYPFLLVDRIVEIEEGRRIVGIKNVTFNEPFFPGHFPQRPIMPGVLIIEAMAQTAGVLMLKREGNLGKLAYLAAINKVKLRRPVLPGDQLRLEVEVSKLHQKTGKVLTKALVEGKVVAEAEMVFSLVEA